MTSFAGTARRPGSADGMGSVAQFQYPYGVAVDKAGNVYVADTSNNTIRKITSAGVVTTLAGMAGVIGSADGTGSAARFYYPYAVAVDASGNVYVADTYSFTVRKITPAGVVTTLAGLAGSSGYLTERAIALVSDTCMELLSTVRAMFTSLIAVTMRFAKSRPPEL